MTKAKQYGSGEYSATPSHQIPAFVGGVYPQGYICMKCGHLTKDLDSIFDDLCLVCLRDFAIKMGVTRLSKVSEALEREALEPTEKIQKNKNEQTTEIMDLKTAKKDLLGNGYRRIDRGSGRALDKK